jgi:hypothetical protein
LDVLKPRTWFAMVRLGFAMLRNPNGRSARQ